MEPVSDRLRQTLLDLGLCRRSDLRRCRRRVLRLADDLPAFDSVWIDALLQARRLTPFQARLLESGRAADLAIGPCVLLDCLGQGRSAATYLARTRDRRQRCVLKLVDLPIETLPGALENLKQLTERLQGPPQPFIAGPHSALRHGDRLVSISRYVEGLRLSELLVRRGRFSPEIVLSIARQLVDGLAWLEERDVVHGDLRLPNVRLTAGGRAVLVDAGIVPAVSPQLTIHAGLVPDRYDGIAPERIGTGQEPAVQSDIYALGCALWQLLAGRPPFPTGDPLAKLAAHQTRAVEDVREWAPDTPDALADVIRRFTDRNAAGRPASFQEIRERLRPARPSGVQRLARFRAEFSSAVRVEHPGRARRRWTMAAGLLSAGMLASIALSDQGIRGDVLAILPERIQRWLDVPPSAELNPAASQDHSVDSADAGAQTLPQPDANGVILLDSAGPYLLGRMSHPDRLVLRGASGGRPVLVVGDQRAALTAPQVVLENMVIRRQVPATADARPTLTVTSQTLEITHCWLEAGTAEPRPSGDNGASGAGSLITWRAIDEQAPRGGWIRIAHSVHLGPASGLSLDSPAANVEATNCLLLGAEALFDLRNQTFPGRGLHLRLEQTTLRGAESLVRWHVPANPAPSAAITVDAVDCVLDLSGPRAALFQLVAPSIPPRLLRALRVTGEGNVATSALSGVTLLAPAGDGFRRLPNDAIFMEGMTSAPFEFAGSPTRRPADSAVRTGSITGPRLSNRTPGIDARALPDAE